MDVTPLLLELIGRIPPLVRAEVEDLDVDQLGWRPGPEANSIGWRVWHLTRVQDHHVAELIAEDQIWGLRDHGHHVLARPPHGVRQHSAPRRERHSGHPRAQSNWPDFRDDGRPRDATIAIRRRDGAIVGT